ncbi:hypothetical protein KP509_34G018100 [Ceratopteris richardii]|uniref:Aluminum resistance protein n=1 Tax=Ceratopteris richardii TaxID=49495 RepID=A0A8T2QJ59_CERRI|nr:hypothetical protein KP509_34G018100 [Ceratopteris richardii]
MTIWLNHTMKTVYWYNELAAERIYATRCSLPSLIAHRKSANRRYSCAATLFCPQVDRAVNVLQPEYLSVDLTVASNMDKVLKAFKNARVGSHHFSGSTGYGHTDAGGREALDAAFAEIVGAESAIVRSQFFSGTHAIACALYGVLRPGGELLAVAGKPYDTLEEVIGLRGTPGHGSLKEYGISYRELELAKCGGIDWDALACAVKPETQCALLQRSCGYSWRNTLTIDEIERAQNIIKAQNPNCVVFVDNCYGEFVELKEPTAVGVDLMAGSLIKNPGGTIVPCGGYVAGKEALVKAAAARLAAPGLGIEVGSTSGEVMRLLFQGLFLSPQMVGEAIKGSLLVAEVMAGEGFKVQPHPRIKRYDIIQAVEMGTPELLVAFCRAVQKRCPVGSYIKPTAGATAGYGSKVIFADGTFIDGSTSELSCDGPLREPYVVFCQGGTHWTHWALVLGDVLEALKAL